MAAYLSQQGHKVQVVSTPPYYPHWQVQDGYRWWSYRKEIWGGVEIYRCPLWVPRQPTGLKRIIHLLSFAVSSLPILLTRWRWRPDIVICIAPALFSAPVAWMAATLAKAKTWLHIQDFELDAALELGLLSTNPTIKIFAFKAEAWLLSKFNRVSTISNRMIQKLIQKGVPEEDTYLFPNWVDTNTIYPLAEWEENPLRTELGLPKHKKIVLYAGNLGRKQGVKILVDAARIMLDHPDILFVICGEGAAGSELEQEASGLQNVRFYPLQPLEKLNYLLNLADIHILPQRADVADLVMPSKLTGMLASGKAIIATAWPGTGVAEVVGQVGVVIPPAEPNALASAIQTLADNPERCKELGSQGRVYLEKHWAAQPVLAAFLEELQNTFISHKPIISGG